MSKYLFVGEIRKNFEKDNNIPEHIMDELSKGIGFKVISKENKTLYNATLLNNDEHFLIPIDDVNCVSNRTVAQLSKGEFRKVSEKTRLTGKSLDAAELFYTEGINNKAKCGRLLGLSRQATSQAIQRIEPHILNFIENKAKKLKNNEVILNKPYISDIVEKFKEQFLQTL